MIWKRRIALFFVAALVTVFAVSKFKGRDVSWEPQHQKKSERTEKKEFDRFVVMIDPGHGGSQPGAQAVYDQGIISEKNINLKIAQSLKKALERYPETEVYMTRDSDKTVGLEERVEQAKKHHAYLFVSIHNNAKGKMSEYDRGCTVITSSGNYRTSFAQEDQELACCILSELESLGLTDQGILLRTSETGAKYPNGKLCDYYNVVKNSLISGIHGIIVEHSFLDNPQDYQEFLSTDEKLKALGEADALGIAKYYGLGEEKNVLSDLTEQITLVTNGEKGIKKKYKKKFFTEK